jgi:hypothetical protein
MQDYKRNAFLEADLQCSNKVQNMESKVRAACNSSNVKLDDIVRVRQQKTSLLLQLIDKNLILYYCLW